MRSPHHQQALSHPSKKSRRKQDCIGRRESRSSLYQSYGSKTVAVQFDFFGECFFYHFPLFVIEDFLVGSSVGPIFRFGGYAKAAVKGDIQLREDFAELGEQVLVAKDAIDDDFRAGAVGVSEVVN